MNRSFFGRYPFAYAENSIDKSSGIFSVGFCIGLFLLLLNDFYLKQTYSNWLTGKLSDFSGLFIFPMFLDYLFQKRTRFNYLLTALFFVFWKSTLATFPIQQLNLILGTSFYRVVDYSDLLALSILPFSYWYQGIAKSNSLNFLKPVLICLSIFSFYATSAPDLDSKETTLLTGNYHYRWEYERFDKANLTIGYETKDCENCYKEVLGPNIIAYGWNKNFIIAKLNPYKNRDIDTTRIVYALIVISKKEDYSLKHQEIYNNLTEAQFISTKRTFNVPDSIQFSRDYSKPIKY